jgi:EAL domain-containing protein (putative c-di-GMP-specific phosphodiesterase class I)
MGFSGLNQILESTPDELKLDRAVVNNVDSDPVREALVEAFCSFGARAGFNIVAEGIETAAELFTIRRLGARLAQGYFLGRPVPLSCALSRRDFQDLVG